MNEIERDSPSNRTMSQQTLHCTSVYDCRDVAIDRFEQPRPRNSGSTGTGRDRRRPAGQLHARALDSELELLEISISRILGLARDRV